jgi:hypothetical protein
MTTEALTFDTYAAEQATAEVNLHADEAWKAAALDAVRSLANRQAFIVADDVWSELGNLDVSTHEARALGAVFVQAKKEHLIEGTGRVVKCRRSVRKGGNQAVWKSLIVSGSEGA